MPIIKVENANFLFFSSICKAWNKERRRRKIKPPDEFYGIFAEKCFFDFQFSYYIKFELETHTKSYHNIALYLEEMPILG